MSVFPKEISKCLRKKSQKPTEEINHSTHTRAKSSERSKDFIHFKEETVFNDFEILEKGQFKINKDFFNSFLFKFCLLFSAKKPAIYWKFSMYWRS